MCINIHTNGETNHRKPAINGATTREIRSACRVAMLFGVISAKISTTKVNTPTATPGPIDPR
jgi:hypothetical protein